MIQGRVGKIDMSCETVVGLLLCEKFIYLQHILSLTKQKNKSSRPHFLFLAVYQQLTMLHSGSFLLLLRIMMTSTNGIIFRVTGLVWGESTGHRWVVPLTKASDTELWCFLRLNKRLNKQSWCRWFETPSGSLWRHRYDICTITVVISLLLLQLLLLPYHFTAATTAAATTPLYCCYQYSSCHTTLLLLPLLLLSHHFTAATTNPATTPFTTATTTDTTPL